MCPEFPNFTSSLIHLSLLILLLRFMVNGLFLSMTFSSLSRKGPLDKPNGTSSESLSVPVTLRSSCAVEQRPETDLSRWTASYEGRLSQWKKRAVVKNTRIPALQPGELKRKVCDGIKIRQSLTSHSGMGREWYNSFGG